MEKTKSSFKRALLSVLVALCLVAAFGLVACSSSDSDEGSAEDETTEEEATEEEAAEEEEEEATDEDEETIELQIFAANSLEMALPEVQELYTEQNPNVTFADTQFKASGDLVEQLAGGAICDLLITASSGTMDDAEEYIDTDTRVDMFTNELVVVVAEGSDIEITSLEDLADLDGTIGIGDPNVVPAGKYALQALESAGLATYDTDEDGTITNIVFDDSIADKIDYGSDKVGTVASHVSTGDFVAGFVYTSDLYRYDGIEAAYTTESDSHSTITYPGAVILDSEYAEAAADFLEFCLTDPEAQQIFANYGFELVG